jgi:hypothetical protein
MIQPYPLSVFLSSTSYGTFTALQNLFDLELFQSKLTSNAKTLADLEKSVLSGLPFWEISEEELMAGDSDERTGLIADLGYKNQLAVKVVERMALEKRYKMTLNQDVEAVKDKFASIEKVMTRLELNGNIETAAQFLIDYSHIAYYTIANSLGLGHGQAYQRSHRLEGDSRFEYHAESPNTHYGCEANLH